MDLTVFKNVYLRNAFLASIFILIVSFGLAVVHFRGVSDLLIIHFTPAGIDIAGDFLDILVILLGGLAIFCVNTALAYALYSRVRYLAYLLSFFSVFSSVLILIAVGVIISVN